MLVFFYNLLLLQIDALSPIFKSIRIKILLVFSLYVAFGSTAFAQLASCPLNIDFELGNFTNWQCFRGSTYANNDINYVTVTPSAPTPNVHEIISKGSLLDPYGNFPISAPDGSNYSVKLGNDGTGAQAEQISYLFNVPANQKDFVITYQYAVVLQDPGHVPSNQPRFTAKVFDITDNKYISCGSFDYVATSALPGFKQAYNQVIYKEWTPASINLYGYQGHQLRLEFTTADCTQGGHFGYAYVDVNTSCSQLIKGTDFCPSQKMFTLNGPAGFDQYSWYNADRSKLFGTGATITIPTAGADGATILLDLVPFIGFGCNYTTSAVVHALPVINFQINDPPPVCIPGVVNLTDANVVSGSDANLNYTYWQDANASVTLTSPQATTQSGTYYIKATAPSGCYDIKPVSAVINQTPTVLITNPSTVCSGSAVDLTAGAITKGSSPALVYSYWQDIAATQPLSAPDAITKAGTFYVKGINSSGCSAIQPVSVSFFPLPVLVVNNPAPVCYPLKVDITSVSITASSESGLNFTYWKDQATTIPLPAADNIALSGTYYIKATNNNGCQSSASVTITVNPLPKLVITNPPKLCFPDKADITAANITTGSSNVAQLTYWTDINATIPLAAPQAVTDSGTYYIKAISSFGCDIIEPVNVIINKLPVLAITNPPKVYVPNTVDVTKAAVTAGSSPGLNFDYYYDAAGSDVVSNPKTIDKTGTYFIRATNKNGCSVIKSIDVTVAETPKILVPTAFTPLQTDNNRLYPFLVGIKTFVTFKVYNRWGILVFETNSPDPKGGWDGKYNGQLHFLDTYSWFAEGYDYVGNLLHRSGNTLLLK